MNGTMEYIRLNDTKTSSNDGHIGFGKRNSPGGHHGHHHNGHHNHHEFNDFSTTGKVLTAEEKAKAAKSRGLCPSCGIQTHALVGRMKQKKRITSYRVYNGVCIGCNPDSVPHDVYRQYQDIKNIASKHGISGESAYEMTHGSADDDGTGGSVNLRQTLTHAHSSSKSNVPQASKLAVEAFLEARKKVHLPTSARRQVMESWDLVKDDLAGLGIDFFIRMFEKYPDLKSLFPFGEDATYMSNDDLRENPALRVHATAAMRMLGSATAGLSDMETMMPRLRELGRMHTNIGVLPEYYDLVYSCLMDAVAKKVGPSKWTAETQEAWKMCYQVITSVMKDPSRFLDVEPPEGWGLVHCLSCAYLAIFTPFRLSGFGGIQTGPLTPLLNLLDAIAFIVCLLDGFSDHIEGAVSLRQRKFRKMYSSDRSVFEEANPVDDDVDRAGTTTTLLTNFVKKKWNQLQSDFGVWSAPVRFRVARYVRGLELGRYSHWPVLDTVIVMSFSIQHSFVAKWARRTSGFEWFYYLVAVVRCVALMRVWNFVRCAELTALKRNILTRDRYQALQLTLLVGQMLYIIHLCGCLYAVVAQLAFLGGGDSDGDGLLDSGFAVKMHPLLESGRTLHSYLHGVYWAFTNVTGIGHHGGSPETSLEFIFAILVHLAGAGYYILAAGNIMNLMQNRAETVYKVEEGISALTSFMDGCDIPKMSQDKFVSSYLMKALVLKNSTPDSAGGSSNDLPTSRPLVPDAAQELPLHLSMELNLFSRAKALRTRGIQLASDDFAFAVVESLIQNLTLLPGDYLFEVGKKVTPRVILVDSGVLEIFVDGVSKGCLYPGDIIGKGWLATLPMENQESSRHKSFLDWRSSDGTMAIADIRAMTECKIVMGLHNRSEVAHLQTLFPHDMKRLAEQCQPSSAHLERVAKNWNNVKSRVLKHSAQSLPLDKSTASSTFPSSSGPNYGRSRTPLAPPNPLRSSSPSRTRSVANLPSSRKGRSLSPKRTVSLPGLPAYASTNTQSLEKAVSRSPPSPLPSAPETVARQSSSVQSPTRVPMNGNQNATDSDCQDLPSSGGSFTARSISSNGSAHSVLSVPYLANATDIQRAGNHPAISPAASAQSLPTPIKSGPLFGGESSLTLESNQSSTMSVNSTNSLKSSMGRKLKRLNFLRKS